MPSTAWTIPSSVLNSTASSRIDSSGSATRPALASASDRAQPVADEVDADDDQDEDQPRHHGQPPLQRLVAARVVVDEHRAVPLQDQQPHRLGQDRAQPPRVADLAAGDEQAHRWNLLSVSDN